MDNLVGKKFNRLTVIKFSHYDKKRNQYWLCKCECGNEKIIRANHFKNGKVQSCGCLLKEASQGLKHGCWSRNRRLNKIWNGMIRRCEKGDDFHAKYYKDREIIVCKEWHDPKVFEDWALKNGYADNLTIDRIDSNGNYEPNNCRWVTQAEQCRNTSKNRYITINNKKMCLSEWLKEFNLSETSFYYRIKKGLSEEEALMKGKKECKI